MIPITKPRDSTGVQQNRDNMVILHDPGEGYQQSTFLRNGSSLTLGIRKGRCPNSGVTI